MAVAKKERPQVKVSVKIADDAARLNEKATAEPRELMQKQIAEAQAELAPWGEAAKRALGRVQDFQRDNRDALNAIATLDLKRFALAVHDPHRILAGLVDRLETLRRELALMQREALTELADVPGRIEALGLPELEQRVFSAEPELHGIVDKTGFHPRGVVAIKWTVRRLENRAQVCRNHLAEIGGLMQRIEAFLEHHADEAPPKTVAARRPDEHRPRPIQETMDS